MTKINETIGTITLDNAKDIAHLYSGKEGRRYSLQFDICINRLCYKIPYTIKTRKDAREANAKGMYYFGDYDPNSPDYESQTMPLMKQSIASAISTYTEMIENAISCAEVKPLVGESDFSLGLHWIEVYKGALAPVFKVVTRPIDVYEFLSNFETLRNDLITKFAANCLTYYGISSNDIVLTFNNASIKDSIESDTTSGDKNPVTETFRGFMSKLEDSGKFILECDFNTIDEFFDEGFVEEDSKIIVLFGATRKHMLTLTKQSAGKAVQYHVSIDINDSDTGDTDSDVIKIDSVIGSVNQFNMVMHTMIEFLANAPSYWEYVDVLENCIK